MKNLFADMDQREFTRVAGIMYLVLIIFGIGSQVTRLSFIDADDAAKTAANIMDNEVLFNAANVGWLISEMFFLLLGIALFMVFRPVNRFLATVMLFLITVGVAMECLNTLNYFAAVHLLSGEEYLAVFTEEQLHAQAMYHINMGEAGYWISAVVSFGPWLIVAGYLMYVSGYFPKALGILAALGGIGITSEAFQAYLAPEQEALAIPGAIIAIVAEFTLMGWFIIKRADIPETGPDEEIEDVIDQADSVT
jgi:hypothetical protein